MTPAGVIHDALMDEFAHLDDAPTSSQCDHAANAVMRALRDEYDTISLNGQRYLMIPEPSPILQAAA